MSYKSTLSKRENSHHHALLQVKLSVIKALISISNGLIASNIMRFRELKTYLKVTHEMTSKWEKGQEEHAL